MIVTVIFTILIELFYILLHALQSGRLVLQILRTHGLYLGLEGFGKLEGLATPLLVFHLKSGADVRGGKFSPRFDVLVEGLADGLQIFRVCDLDLNPLAEGVDEVLHLFAHGLKVLDYILGMGLDGGRVTLKCFEKRGKVESRLSTGSSSMAM